MSGVALITDGGLPAFQARHAGRPQLLVFTAPWCAPCRAMAPAIDDLADLYAGQVGIGRISIDACPALAARFGVRTVPTLVLLRDGGEAARLVGAVGKTRVAAMLETDPEGNGQA